MSTSHLRIPSGSHPDHSNGNAFDLVIRFSASIPDLQVTVPASPEPTTATLKQLIRQSIPSDLRDRRIRLIHAGKALEDGASLSATIKRPLSHPPSRTPTPSPKNGTNSSNAGIKGKEPVRDTLALARTYVHCSIGDVVLSAKELASEEVLANRETRQSEGHEARLDHEHGTNQASGEGSATTAPRGFDRLLSTGFSTAEVQNLRLQFMAIQAHIHTPDTMPSPNTLRSMEDRWLDNSNTTDAGGGSATALGMSNDDVLAGALDDMLWGATLGFFWPIGCLFWGFREDGIWSQRRKMAIVVGVVLNIGIGLIRYTS